MYNRCLDDDNCREQRGWTPEAFINFDRDHAEITQKWDVNKQTARMLEGCSKTDPGKRIKGRMINVDNGSNACAQCMKRKAWQLG